MSEENKPTTLASVDHLLKEVYIDQLNSQLKHDNLFFGGKKFAPYKPTRKERWNKFWNHIPDFYRFIRSYEYRDWQYKE